MSTEVNSLENQTEPSKVNHQQKVDINILLNRVRHEKKKERKEKKHTHTHQFTISFLIVWTR